MQPPESPDTSGTPDSAEKHLPAPAACPADPAAPAKLPLLIVDDDAAIRETIRLLFDGTGYELLEASNGAEALTILRESSVSLVVLLDELMPMLSGEGVLRAVLHDRQLRRRHVFILISAVPHLSRRLRLQRLLRALAIEMLPKPFDVDDLEEAIARAQQRQRDRPAFGFTLPRWHRKGGEGNQRH